LTTIPDKKLTVIDVGCGAGWKLVHYLAKEFKTIGVETEPAISFLRKTYPDLVMMIMTITFMSTLIFM
jgi:hypothetical protein